MNLRHLVLAALPAALLALMGCGGTTLQIQPEAAKSSTSAGQPAAATGAAAAPTRCDAGPWTGAISPEGRPDNFDAGDAGAVYVWHDGDGWHIRSTDARPVDHHYTGTIHLDPAAANFANIRTVRDERDDHVSVDGTNTLHYDFHTYASIDGVDFTITCPGGRRDGRERLAYHTDFDGHPISDRVRIGDRKQSPKSADFAFVRVV